MAKKIFFCHIPKTGGTSIRRALEVHFKRWQTIPDAFMMSRNGGQYPPIDIPAWVLARQLDAVALFRGHYHYSCHQFLGPDAIKIVILRDPIARYLSLLKHMLKNGLVTPEALEQSLATNSIPSPDNQMTRYLGGRISATDQDEPDAIALKRMRVQHHVLLSAPIRNPQKRLASAKRALDSCDFVGTTENLKTFVDEISKHLDLDIAYDHMNKSTQDLVLTPKQMETIEHHHALDWELYRYASR